MLYKNKIKGQNILKSAVALMLMLTLSLSTVLSPLAKAEEAKYTWKTVTSVPSGYMHVSPDGSKLFIREEDSSHNTILWMSADDGATWRKIFSKQTTATASIFDTSISADGSKIVVKYEQSFSISTDGGQSWVEHGSVSRDSPVLVSPDGSFLTKCIDNALYTTHISTDDGQTWTPKGVAYSGCPVRAFNNGTLLAFEHAQIERSDDYGQTWRIANFRFRTNEMPSANNNGNNIFDVDRITLDGGDHWTPSTAPIPAGYTVHQTDISDDGKKLFVTAGLVTAGVGKTTLLTSVDGGRTWHSEDVNTNYTETIMSSNGSKLLYLADDGLHVGTLPAAQPVTPGAGAGGTVTPSTGSTSAALNQKPGKASGRLAETGISVQLIGGLAVVTVAAGALVLRKRL